MPKYNIFLYNLLELSCYWYLLINSIFCYVISENTRKVLNGLEIYKYDIDDAYYIQPLFVHTNFVIINQILFFNYSRTLNWNLFSHPLYNRFMKFIHTTCIYHTAQHIETQMTLHTLRNPLNKTFQSNVSQEQ